MTQSHTRERHDGAAHGTVASVAGVLVNFVVVTLKTIALLAALAVALPIVLVPLAVIGVLLVVGNVGVGPFAGHYRHLLTRRYMRRKLIPLFSAVAVSLCTAMVVIVLSVMGGFIELLRDAGHTLMGDVSLHAGLGGFPRYDELIDEIEKAAPGTKAAPLIEAWGLLKLPGDVVRAVHVFGVDGRRLAEVTSFGAALYWTPQRLKQRRDDLAAAQDRLRALQERDAELYAQYIEARDAEREAEMAAIEYEMQRLQRELNLAFARVNGDLDILERYRQADPVEAALSMQSPWPKMSANPAAVVGIEVGPYNERTSEGEYVFPIPLPGRRFTLTVLPVTAAGQPLPKPETEQVVIVNEFISGLFEVDDKQVFIPFDIGQRMMRMDEAVRYQTDEDGLPVIGDDGEPVVIGKVPTRCTWIYLKAPEGMSYEDLRDRVRGVYDRLAAKYPDLPPPQYMSVATWEQRQAAFLRAVGNEKGLMAFLFGIISIVSVVMVGVIFYTIVTEKTRDIGILRAIGASQLGVASIFLSFGAVTGLIAAAIGCTIGALFVLLINEIHTWMGNGLGATAVVLGGTSIGLLTGLLVAGGLMLLDAVADRQVVSGGRLRRVALIVGACMAVGALAPLAAFAIIDGAMTWANENLGIVIWDRSIYFFDRIPSRVNPIELTVIVIVAITASVVGSMLPAMKAAMVDPVESLRYE